MQEVSSWTKNTAGRVGDHCRPVTARPAVLRPHCSTGRSDASWWSLMLPSQQPACGRETRSRLCFPFSQSHNGKHFQSISVFHFVQQKYLFVFETQNSNIKSVLTNNQRKNSPGGSGTLCAPSPSQSGSWEMNSVTVQAGVYF